ncbi:MAG TPA: hypothetical protein VI504_05765 [Candidatus Eisenbacteria bacterium]|jgi:hypothetical protein
MTARANRLGLGTALGLAALAAGAWPARAVPSPSTSHVPAHVVMVGRVGTQADTAFGAFTVVVRDVANAPVANSSVEFRVLNCEGARLATDALQPGVSTRCDTHGITAVTDVNGEVRLTLIGGGTPGAAPGGGSCAQVFASGVLLGMVSVSFLDMDGQRGLGVNDLSLWLADLALNEPISRSDFDGNGALTPNDLSVWLTAWSRAKSYESASSYCP